MNATVERPPAVNGPAPLAVVMLALNEEHNMEAILDNLAGFAQEIFLVDSYSTDATLDIALRHGVQVVQRRFRGFGDQWNFAMAELPISAPWTMKLDPDERLSDPLKASIRTALAAGAADGFVVARKLWFMGCPLPIHQHLLRIWRSGTCRFSDVTVNEYPLVKGRTVTIPGDLEHHDSPNLHHWMDKQNRYTTAEALSMYRGSPLAAEPRLFGSGLQRRMWLKMNFYKIPFRYLLLFLYVFLLQGAWRAGKVGYFWARLRTEVYRTIEAKYFEMRRIGRAYEPSDRISATRGSGAGQQGEHLNTCRKSLEVSK